MHSRVATVVAEEFERAPLWHIPLILLVSIGFESAFLRSGISLLDEGWPIYAAMQAHAGRTLYDDILWVFPPLHMLPARIAYALDPPGIVLFRVR